MTAKVRFTLPQNDPRHLLGHGMLFSVDIFHFRSPGGVTYHTAYTATPLFTTLIGKRVVDFLLVLIKPFARCYGGGATSEYRLKIGDFALTGAG